jgi:hypothetical protein
VGKSWRSALRRARGGAGKARVFAFLARKLLFFFEKKNQKTFSSFLSGLVRWRFAKSLGYFMS